MTFSNLIQPSQAGTWEGGLSQSLGRRFKPELGKES